MPEITRFYGIIIKLFFAGHPPAHFHAICGEYNAIFNLETLEFIEGEYEIWTNGQHCSQNLEP
ncbi:MULTISPECIES: DUF4160 domain-containing protein [Cylindrospermopsis]|jgi:hypothetical protein|uniref:DUF4160 domain-containing protein n=1 Tax=Cylindrospermopsis TaxID=77021 RepID=UPI0007094ED7|nr:MULTISPECIES: DUF4160 domain-containing protein [Cylindrospermopsis]MBU6344991.1 DUF4160 domain-containing protein [Cyanobacteria bacterium REEB494]KRH95587.1 hypothetical protein ASL19_10990 [Cylindrospermopsis sp. CR12]TPX29374.1 DUF4160 domain-containing protein [Cylindrospermopsis raciborskii GIHE 2018]UJL32538.1 DUF4160 domain-containing protein [Cylindrospermopsis raciborskii Cr2010]UJS04991.1 DUF4160 domain-containing protein [Cylindrospermopsis raciborskii KLL07]